jgi:hypothetical protein
MISPLVHPHNAGGNGGGDGLRERDRERDLDFFRLPSTFPFFTSLESDLLSARRGERERERDLRSMCDIVCDARESTIGHTQANNRRDNNDDTQGRETTKTIGLAGRDVPIARRSQTRVTVGASYNQASGTRFHGSIPTALLGV